MTIYRQCGCGYVQLARIALYAVLLNIPACERLDSGMFRVELLPLEEFDKCAFAHGAMVMKLDVGRRKRVGTSQIVLECVDPQGRKSSRVLAEHSIKQDEGVVDDGSVQILLPQELRDGFYSTRYKIELAPFLRTANDVLRVAPEGLSVLVSASHNSKKIDFAVGSRVVFPEELDQLHYSNVARMRGPLAERVRSSGEVECNDETYLLLEFVLEPELRIRDDSVDSWSLRICLVLS